MDMNQDRGVVLPGKAASDEAWEAVSLPKLRRLDDTYGGPPKKSPVHQEPTGEREPTAEEREMERRRTHLREAQGCGLERPGARCPWP
jgi:hypothetical protein